MANPLFDALFAPHSSQLTTFLHPAAGPPVSYQSFLRRAAQFANSLDSRDLVPGDRVAVQIEKSVTALALYAACVQTGIVYLPLNTAYTPHEVEYFLSNSAAKLFVCNDSNHAEMGSVARLHDIQLTSLHQDGTGPFADIANGMSDARAITSRKPDDLAALLYTSGTTGHPKGAMLTHRNLLSNARALRNCWQFSSRDTLLHALPLFHSHGLFVATNVTLLTGATMILLPKFEVDAVIRALPNATTMMGVPTFYTRLLAAPKFTRDLVAHMRLFISGSAPLLPETHIQFQNRTGHQILERYGMTETNMNTSNPYRGERRAGSVGCPLAGIEIRVTDGNPTGELPAGEIGHIEVRGANVFKGYWNMPEQTASTFHADGFFRTGDLGYVDTDGYLQLIGRQSDMIISGGYNIYPREIERVLDGQVGVRESAVVGVPHPDLGEGAIAILATANANQVNLPEIEVVLRDSLARFKHPKRWFLVSELPRNAMGKVQKNLLRDQYAQTFLPAG